MGHQVAELSTQWARATRRVQGIAPANLSKALTSTTPITAGIC